MKDHVAASIEAHMLLTEIGEAIGKLSRQNKYIMRHTQNTSGRKKEKKENKTQRHNHDGRRSERVDEISHNMT
jgi:Sec-independent protein translocase protein TatA